MFSDEEVKQSYKDNLKQKQLAQRSQCRVRSGVMPKSFGVVAWCLNEDTSSPKDDIEEVLRR